MDIHNTTSDVVLTTTMNKSHHNLINILDLRKYRRQSETSTISIGIKQRNPNHEKIYRATWLLYKATAREEKDIVRKLLKNDLRE